MEWKNATFLIDWTGKSSGIEPLDSLKEYARYHTKI